ncbi:hypothetical protein K438DRAFT_1746831 [Mycena galopus ATCC 62051]|nr:hypothetical protein K438DRAFT_1746831 [Mycena galopus ATCC 62051]
MLFSSKITERKDDIAKCWGNSVVGTEHNKSFMDVVSMFLSKILTQSCSTIKKEIVKSVKVPFPDRVKKEKKEKHTPSLCPTETHTTIYQLTKLIAQKLCGGRTISIPITAALCSHVASMCKWHIRTIKQSLNTNEFWDFININLEKIHATARKDTTDINEIVKRVAR